MAFLDGPRPIAVAHRGGTESAPENTVAAFRAAQAVGFRYLETDVHLSADGVLVAFHDDVLDRVTDTSGAIADLHSSDIAAARLGDGHTIP
ncbi:MAG: glycerophosphodiester phosphodiesterase, partial [Acidobacteria bacterium]|nr:glycerophosphodiester phosphodiesterase [Acidobacteriota bacterium]